jgi:5-methylcytosine-specific restriction protein A
MPYQPKTHKISRLKVKKEDNRPNSGERGYDNSWRKVRNYHLLGKPLCEDCLKENRYESATDVHHKIKLADRPDLRDDPNNLMSLCHSCHSKRTAQGE